MTGALLLEGGPALRTGNPRTCREHSEPRGGCKDFLCVCAVSRYGRCGQASRRNILSI